MENIQKILTVFLDFWLLISIPPKSMMDKYISMIFGEMSMGENAPEKKNDSD